MGGAHAFRIITVVTHKHPSRYSAVVKKPRKSMCSSNMRDFFGAKLPVTVGVKQSSSPFPTCFSFVDF